MACVSEGDPASRDHLLVRRHTGRAGVAAGAAGTGSTDRELAGYQCRDRAAALGERADTRTAGTATAATTGAAAATASAGSAAAAGAVAATAAVVAVVAVRPGCRGR